MSEELSAEQKRVRAEWEEAKKDIPRHDAEVAGKNKNKPKKK